MGELNVPFTRLANEIVEALSRTNLSAYESRVLWCIFRKTYGFQQKEDWISSSQIRDMTGLKMSHVSRSKNLLTLRNMITLRGNKIGFNKYWTQWKQLPNGVTSHAKSDDIGSDKPETQEKLPNGVTTEKLPNGVTELPNGVTNSYLTGDQKLPNGGYTKEERKETLQKQPEKIKETDGNMKVILMAVIEKYKLCDIQYAEKTWEQGSTLSGKDRERFFRKATTVSQSRNEGFARKVFHEMAGIVNDKGAMKSKLSISEIHQREEFAEDTADNKPDLQW